MTLEAKSIEWAIEFVETHSDGDLFPKVLEMLSIHERKNDFVSSIEGKPLASFHPNPCRRFIVPKDEISYRQATQLHPQDSIILSAVIYQFGNGIENRRLDAKQVFSYRFNPTIDNGLYQSKDSWNNFWQNAKINSRHSNVVLYCDIADFYNQIYHHTVENQLIASGFPNQAVKWVVALLESTTAGVSRGVPIGPHPIHLIAEATLIPIDNSLSANGLKFMRYADDIVIFCASKKEANNALGLLASTLDKQQRLMLQRHKTKFYQPLEFQKICDDMIEDRPIDENEDKLLGIIRKYTGGNPYKQISYNSVSKEDWEEFSSEIVRKIIEEYLSKEEIDFIRLRWFYRRLAQVGHPGALDVSIENFEKLGPCLANICSYISSIQSINNEEWKTIGSGLIELLESEQIKNNEFFRLSILSIFTKNKYINHFDKLAKIFQSSDPFARREILLAANVNEAIDWLREHKENYIYMDSWQKMAFLFCCKKFPADEKKYFINRLKHECPFEESLFKWAKEN